MARVSVVVAVRNGVETLQRCIRSVTAQSHGDVELVVIDGASTDGTPEVLERNAASIAYQVSEPDRGIYDAWNKALEHVTGEWVCFLGADDAFASQDAVALLLAAASGVELVTAKVAVVDQNGRVRSVVGQPWDWDGMRRHQVVAHPGALHHRTLFERLGRFDDSFRIAGDYQFLLRLGPDARVAFVDAVVVLMGEGGVSQRALLPFHWEAWKAQARSPAVGVLRATWNLSMVLARGSVRRVLRRT